MNPETMNSTNYNEEEAVIAVAKKRQQTVGISVMNAALPQAPAEEQKTPKKRRPRPEDEPSAKSPPSGLAARRQRQAKANHTVVVPTAPSSPPLPPPEFRKASTDVSHLNKFDSLGPPVRKRRRISFSEFEPITPSKP